MNWQDTEPEPIKTEGEGLTETKLITDDFLEEAKQPE